MHSEMGKYQVSMIWPVAFGHLKNCVRSHLVPSLADSLDTLHRIHSTENGLYSYRTAKSFAHSLSLSLFIVFPYIFPVDSIDREMNETHH